MRPFAQTETHAPPADTDTQASRTEALAPHARVEHLFRFSLRRGQINPLMHILLHYRSGFQEQEHGSGI